VSDITYDIGEMLDSLKMTTAAIRWKQLLNDPELGNFTAQQLLREVITPQYVEAMNKQYATNLKFSRLMERSARIENLKTGNGRKYNDETVQQILTFNFITNGLNVGIYGKTGAGKSYFTSALCNEACRLNYRCQFHDYCDMMDELLRFSREDLTKYSKKLKYYSRLRILFIDDFCISRYSEDGIKILYHLLKSRADLHYPTVFNSQYEPSEWGMWLSDDPGCFGKLDGIRRRLTTGFTVEIVKL
jgi:DNA replication protein DnaC